jgi:hypothetical protein
MQSVVALVARAQPAQAVQVREGPLDDPALAAEPGAMLAAAPGDLRLDAALAQFAPYLSWS